MILGVLLALGTSVSWAFGNVFIAKSGQRLGGPRALTWALAAGGVLSVLAALAFDQRTAPVTPAVAGWLLLAGVAGVVAYASIFYAFAHAKLSLAVPFVTLWSLVAGAFSLTVLGQRAHAVQLVGAGVVLIGVILVSVGAQRGKDAAAATSLGVGSRPLAVALLAGFAFGIMIPAMAEATPACGSFGTAAAAYAIGIVIAVPVARLRGIALGPPSPGTRWLVLGAGLTETLGFVFLNAAGRLAPVALVAPVASLASVFTVLYAALFLRERPGALALLGALVASVGVVVLASSR